MKYPYSSDVISEFGSVRVITPSFNELITIISDLVSTSIYAAVTVPFSIEYFTENYEAINSNLEINGTALTNFGIKVSTTTNFDIANSYLEMKPM